MPNRGRNSIPVCSTFRDSNHRKLNRQIEWCGLEEFPCKSSRFSSKFRDRKELKKLANSGLQNYCFSDWCSSYSLVLNEKKLTKIQRIQRMNIYLKMIHGRKYCNGFAALSFIKFRSEWNFYCLLSYSSFIPITFCIHMGTIHLSLEFQTSKTFGEFFTQ